MVFVWEENPARRRTFPSLPDRLRAQLEAVEPSGGGYEPVYAPCEVVLRDGSVRDRVYLCEAQPWFDHWGVWPDDDPGKSSVAINDVMEVRDSPSRLPARFANELYQAGESGMGYTIFTVHFDDGASAAYLTGNAVDFITYPGGQGTSNVVRVSPHEGRDAYQAGPEYAWCLFSEGRRL